MLVAERIWDSFSAWAMGWGGVAGLAGVILLTLWYFTPAILSSPAAKAMLLNAGLGCLAFAFVSGYFIKSGFESCVSLINSRDAAAISRAKGAVREIEVCRDAGGAWDVTDGTCHK